MFALMTIREIYRAYLQQLVHIYTAGETATITGWVFEKIAGLQRADIIKNPGNEIDPAASIRLQQCLEELLRHRPVQYVLGEAWFYKMKLAVNELVLIPRPETEELVQLVIGDWQSLSTPNNFFEPSKVGINTPGISMLDIGTGSGCIAIALKKNLPDITMHAIDISAGALDIAKQNALVQNVEILFSTKDFLDEAEWAQLPAPDAIISNPPYIPDREKGGLDKNVSLFEPAAALFVPDNEPLLFYKKIARFGSKNLRANGKLYLEIHENFARETARVFEGLYAVDIKKDIFGKERMLVAVKLT